MAFVKLRRWAVGFAVVVSTAAIGVVAPASSAYADTGG
jgi:hypothetical protein